MAGSVSLFSSGLAHYNGIELVSCFLLQKNEPDHFESGGYSPPCTYTGSYHIARLNIIMIGLHGYQKQTPQGMEDGWRCSGYRL